MTYLPAHAKHEVDYPGLVQRGSGGMKARRVQEWLAFHDCPTTIDGGFGSATETAVRAFQEKEGLPVSGKVNQETWDALVTPLINALSADISSRDSLDAAVFKLAKAHLQEHPIELGGDNRGAWVRLYTGGNEGPEWRWCAGFVTFIMKQACDAMQIGMPIVGSASCDSLAYQAREKDLFVKGKSLEDGAITWSELGRCQVFLVRQSPTDWVHTGFSFDGAVDVFATIEGNTNDDGSANGFEVCRRTRSITKKDFIRFPT